MSAENNRSFGRVTIPTDVDVVPETLELIKRWWEVVDRTAGVPIPPEAWDYDNVDVHAYVKNGRFCVVNNTYEPQSTTVYRGDGSSFSLELASNEIRWYEL